MTTLSSKGKIFFAHAQKGYIFKVLVEVLSCPLQRGYFTLKDDGIYLRHTDMNNTILFNVKLERRGFIEYVCKKKAEMTISINLKQVQRHMRNVKKKDSIILYIEENEEAERTLKIYVRPDRSVEGTSKKSRFENIRVAYQVEHDYGMTGLPEGGYKDPVVINASEFQKIKRLANLSKVINIVMQKSNYLSFDGDAGIGGSEIGFGELNWEIEEHSDDNPIVEERSSNNNRTELDDSDSDDSDSEDWAEEEFEGCEDDDEECNTNNNIRSNNNNVIQQQPSVSTNPLLPANAFHKQYYANMLNLLVKLPGLCSQMQFCAPTIQNYPLLIKMDACQSGIYMGTVEVYIKDVPQITFEESLKIESEGTNIIVHSKRGKKKVQ